jgi:small subunit ribosomal protein S3
MTYPVHVKRNIKKEYNSVWYTSRSFAEVLHQDILLRKFFKDILKQRFNNVYIYRKLDNIQLIIYYNPPFDNTSRHILLDVFNKLSVNLKDLQKIFKKNNIEIKIIKTSKILLDNKGNVRTFEVKDMDNLSVFTTNYISYFLRKNIKNKRVFNILEENIKKNLLILNKVFNRSFLKDNKVIESKIKLLGYCVKCSGPFKRADRAETKWIIEGKLPKNTITGDIEYGFKNVNTLYGSFGAKVWIYYRNIK